jgi:phage gpG-like protein
MRCNIPILMADKFDLNGLDKRIKKALQSSLNSAGVLAVNHFKQSFRDGGFTDNTFVAWKKRKDKSKKSQGRAILVKSGDLRRSIKATKKNYNNLTLVISTSGVPYAQIHNEGGQINKGSRETILNFRDVSTNIATRSVKRVFAKGTNKGLKILRATSSMKATIGAHTVNMPKRQFIGNSHKLNVTITNMIEKKLKFAFNK